MKLAPSNPDVLYIQGVLYLRKRDWAQAETVLAKSTQVEPNQARAAVCVGHGVVQSEEVRSGDP